MNPPRPHDASAAAPKRALWRAIGRGLRRRCPTCGKGETLRGYISPRAECAACGEKLAQYQTADFAPYLATFFTGFAYTPMIVAVSLSAHPIAWAAPALIVAALITALILLPIAKGAAINLLWALDIQRNQ
jgi:uncharacterized protein (DUF983 family)